MNIDGHLHENENKPKKASKLSRIFSKIPVVPTVFVLIFALLGGIGLWAEAATTDVSLWSSKDVPKVLASEDNDSIELGVKFQSAVSGDVVGVKFYKSAQNKGAHTGTLWDYKGNELATVKFNNETRSGWQTAKFPKPVTIAANVPYIISYHAPRGHYSFTKHYFKFAHQNDDLTALSNSDGNQLSQSKQSRKHHNRGGNSRNGNGVYSFGKHSVFPTQSKKATNYWVDVVFAKKLLNPAPAPGAPSGLKASQSGSNIVLSWKPSLSANDVKTYNIYRDGKQIDTTTSATSYTDTTVEAGKKYSYQVQAVDSTNAKSKLSSAVQITISKSTPSPTPTPAPTPTPTPGSWWKPAADKSISWHWVIGNTPAKPFKQVQVYDIDGFDNSAATVKDMHSQGIKVICYIDVGTYEPGRTDGSLIPSSAIGKGVSGWPGEKWLNIADINGLKPMVVSRMKMCADKGFDAIEPDNIDGYTNNTGFPLTAGDQLAYNKFLAETAHSLGLSIGLKNDVDQLSQLAPYFDWALNEECNKYKECGGYSAFTKLNKAVFNAEYTSDGQTTAKFCAADAAAHINGVLFDLDLTGKTYQPCTQNW